MLDFLAGLVLLLIVLAAGVWLFMWADDVIHERAKRRAALQTQTEVQLLRKRLGYDS